MRIVSDRRSGTVEAESERVVDALTHDLRFDTDAAQGAGGATLADVA